MLKLYHWEPNAASARAMITLLEKGLEFDSRYVDVLSFEQFTAEFLALNEQGQVPVLLQQDRVCFESSYLCEYLDEAFAAVPLLPAAPFDRWRVREWQKYVDDFIAPSVSLLAWQAYQPVFRRDHAESAAQAIPRIPAVPRREAWREALAEVSPERLEAARERLHAGLTKAEQDLSRGPWLAGDWYSLADIAVFSYLNYLPHLLADTVDLAGSPQVGAWLARMSRRPAVLAALARARQPNAFAVAAPGAESIRWG